MVNRSAPVKQLHAVSRWTRYKIAGMNRIRESVTMLGQLRVLGLDKTSHHSQDRKRNSPGRKESRPSEGERTPKGPPDHPSHSADGKDPTHNRRFGDRSVGGREPVSRGSYLARADAHNAVHSKHLAVPQQDDIADSYDALRLYFNGISIPNPGSHADPTHPEGDRPALPEAVEQRLLSRTVGLICLLHSPRRRIPPERMHLKGARAGDRRSAKGWSA